MTSLPAANLCHGRAFYDMISLLVADLCHGRAFCDMTSLCTIDLCHQQTLRGITPPPHRHKGISVDFLSVHFYN